MVCTISTGAPAEYYLDAQRSTRHPNSYYVGGEEPDGVWWNPKGLFDLKDNAPFDPAEYRRLYAGFAPDGSGARLTRNAGSENRTPILDITFSADKSISALWAVAPEDVREKIERAHHEAARWALQETLQEHCSWTRIRNKDGIIEVVPADICGAIFQHGSSRANDPQLHSHCTIFNVAKAHGDGKFRALHMKPIYRWKKAAGAMYRAALAWNLQQSIGVQMEQYGREGAFTKIADGLPDELVNEWSKRRMTIIEAAEDAGFDVSINAARAANINKITRQSKDHHDNDPEKRHTRWREEAEALAVDIEAEIERATGKEFEISQDQIRELTEALEQVPEDLTLHEAVFRLPDVYEKVANLTAGLLGHDAIKTSLERALRSPEIVRLDRPEQSADAAAGLTHTRVFSTRHHVEMEQRIREMTAEMVTVERLRLAADKVEKHVERLRAEGYPLSGEQIDAIRYTTLETGNVAIIEGAAGSGKTTTLRPITDLFKERGCTVIGTAVAWRTAVALGSDCDIQPFSVDKMLRMVARGKLQIGGDTVIIVDEAGMLSVRQAHHILEVARAAGAKIVFAGDTQQQQAIEAGPGLRLARDIAGSVRVDEIRRQRATLEEILEHERGLDQATARLQAGLTGAEERERILEAFESRPDKPDWTPWQITASEAFRDCNAAQAIAAYDAHGRFHVGRNLDQTLTKLVDDWASYQRANPGKSTVVLARTNAEVRALSQLMRNRNLAGRPGSERVRVDVCRGRLGDRKISPIEIARGDRLRIGATCWHKHLFNGTIVNVDDVELLPGGRDGEPPAALISGRTEHGRAVQFRHDEITDYYGNIRIDYGYALTIASAQGLTVDQAFLLADEKPARETIYPACTRHREGLDIYVDRQPIAMDIQAQRSEDKADQEVTDAEVKDHLARRWSREQPKEAARDFMSAAMRRDLEEARRPTDPDRRDAASWLASNDNGDGRLRKMANAVRFAALDLRHGAAVDAFAHDRKEVVAAYDQFRERIQTDGNVVALQPAFRETLDRHAELLGTAERFRADSRFGALLRRRVGINPADVDAFEQLLASASAYRREAIADHGTALTDAATENVAGRAELTSPEPGRGLGQEMFEQFLKDWETFAVRAGLAGRAGKHAFYAPDYPEMRERMLELAARADLSDDAREFMEATLRGHDELVADRGEVMECLKAAQNLTERRGLMTADANKAGTRILEVEAYPKWREDAEGLVSYGKRMLGDPERYGPHLRETRLGNDTLGAALEKIEAFLEVDNKARIEREAAEDIAGGAGRASPEPGRGLGQEMFEQFLKDWETFAVRAGLAGRAGKHAFYASDYPEMHGRMLELAARADLSDDAREFMEATLRGHDELVADRGEVMECLKAAQNLTERRGLMTADANKAGTRILEVEAYPKWREDAEGLVSYGKRMLGDPERYGPHLRETRLGNDTLGAALEKIEAFLEVDNKARIEREAAAAQTAGTREYDRLVADWREFEAEAKRAGIHPFYAPGYDRLHQRMADLADREDIPDHGRQVLAKRLEVHGHLTERHGRVEEFLAAVDRNWERRQELVADAQTAEVFLVQTEGYPRWREDAEELHAAGTAILADPDLELHLEEIPLGRALTRDAIERFEQYRAGDSEIEAHIAAAPKKADWSWETAEKRLDIETADRSLEDGPTEGRGRSM